MFPRDLASSDAGPCGLAPRLRATPPIPLPRPLAAGASPLPPACARQLPLTFRSLERSPTTMSTVSDILRSIEHRAERAIAQELRLMMEQVLKMRLKMVY